MFKPQTSQIRYYNPFGATSAVFFSCHQTQREQLYKTQSREPSESKLLQHPVSQIVYGAPQQKKRTQNGLNLTIGEASKVPLIRQPSPSVKQQKEQLQKDWVRIIDKTRNLEDNLLMLKQSISQNLMKKQTDARLSKESTSSGHSILPQKLRKVAHNSKIKSPFDNNHKKRTTQKSHPQDRLFTEIEHKFKLKMGNFLGRGKFSEVHMAIDTVSGFIFALKMIKKTTVLEYQMEGQLLREIMIQTKLEHQGIVKMYGQTYDENYIYMMLEYCNGGELFQHQYKQVNKKFNETVACGYIKQILNAIEYMHQQGYMHRDLKTENILLSLDHMKLCDLGCVREIPMAQDDRRTTFCGTVDYIAPEVITEGGYDQRCDIWQIAILAYELVCGTTPFAELPRDDESIMERIMQNQFKLPDNFSQELKDFVICGLQKSPEKRISIEAMLRHPWILMAR